jgi:ring-1,2-phenylacetyl-CoA epoxidase subunit PaaB
LPDPATEKTAMMKKKKSLDPRVNRMNLFPEESGFEEQDLLQWQTYEVFQQKKRGDQHIHVGGVHAPNPELALVLAKEQFGRREQCANLWVVKTGDIHATSYEDAGMFQHAFDKSYREGDGYRVKTTIDTFMKELDDSIEYQRKGTNSIFHKHDSSRPHMISEGGSVVIQLPPVDGKRRKIIIKKR